MDDRVGDGIEQAVRRWREHGWVLLPGLIPTDEIDAALEDVWTFHPRPEEYHGSDPSPLRDAYLGDRGQRIRIHRPDDGTGPAFRNDQFLGRKVFPFPGSGALNRLPLHPRLLDFAERALGRTDLRLYQMSIWTKYTGVTDYEQPMHQDQNHSILPFRAEPPWWHLEGFLYLTDVDEDLAPTRAVDVGVSRGRQRIGTIGPDEAPELYAGEVSAAGPRGSYLAYRPDVYHRGVDLTRPGGARVLYNVSYKAAGHDWIGFETYQPQATGAPFARLVAECTPRQLAVLGVPEPGHPFWNDAMLDAMAERYPGLDLAPWREALSPR